MSARAARSIEEFFDGLAATEQRPLHELQGTVRFDVDEDGTVEHWLMNIDHGQVDISRRNSKADAVVGADQALFGRMISGDANAMTAGLRGQLRFEGDPRLVVAFGRLLPGPPGGHTTLPPAGRRAKEAAQAAIGSGTATRTARVSAAVAGMTRKDRSR
jgi:putative sterol carrier protein